MKTKNDFPLLLDSYFNTHLKLERKFCDNTYITYLSTIKQFIHYLDFIGIKRKNVSFKDFSKRNVLDYLAYEQKEKDCTARTRNHHLSVINSYLEYVQSVNPLYIKQYLEVKSIKHQKENKKIVAFMTVEELNYVLNECNLSSKSGYKHFVMLSLLYESGCRVSELINIKKEDINIGENSYIRVMGKGNKERIIYISNTVVDILITYFKDYHIMIDSIFLNHSGQPFTRFGVNKLVMKYTGQASEKCASLKEKTISPHSFRHSKAVHFLLNGTALPVIQRFLGHNQIQTTEVYLAVTSDVIINAVNEVSELIDYKTDEKSVWKGDRDLMGILESFKK